MLATGGEATVAPRIGRYLSAASRRFPISARRPSSSAAPPSDAGAARRTARDRRAHPLKAKIRYPRVVRQIEATLTGVAGQQGVSAEDLAEMSLPTYDLSRDGERHLPVGDATAIIRVCGTRDDACSCSGRQDGRETATLPKSLKDAAPEAVAAARKLRKEIGRPWRARRRGSRRLSLRPQAPVRAMAERYLEHPLLAGWRAA